MGAIKDGTIKANVQNLLNSDDYKLFVFQCLDENICSKIIVNGSMFVRDTAKMRDMTKNYIAGNFKGNDYVEIGKSLLDDDEDRSPGRRLPTAISGLRATALKHIPLQMRDTLMSAVILKAESILSFMLQLLLRLRTITSVINI